MRANREGEKQTANPERSGQGGRGLMTLIAAVIRLICALNVFVGRACAWLSLGVVLVCFTVVVQRYVFAISYVWMQDLYIWLSGAMFTAVAGFALQRDDHVRVDIFYRPAPLRRKALIDLFGVAFFLLPFTWVVYEYSTPFVVRAWSYHEASANVGGMPGLFILKSFIILFAALIALQGVAMALRSVLVLAGREALLPEKLRYRDDAAGEPTGAA